MINPSWENLEVLLEEVILGQALKYMKEVIRWRTVKIRNKMQGLRKNNYTEKWNNQQELEVPKDSGWPDRGHEAGVFHWSNSQKGLEWDYEDLSLLIRSSGFLS